MRDLGIILNNQLSYRPHIEQTVKTAFQKMYLLLRNVKCGDKKLYIKLYKAYVLPHLEYGSQIWNSFVKKDVRAIENVQKTFTRILFYRLFPNCNYPRALPSYIERLQRLNMRSLFYRRVCADLVLAFQIIRLETKLVPSDFLVWKPCSGRRAGFSFQFSANECENALYDESFFVRTSRWLQKLPPEILSSPTSFSFKQRLKKLNVLPLLNLNEGEYL